MLESVRRLHYINTILKYSSFSKAAHELYITQPSLTQIIQGIERKDVGATIINRSQRPYSLTNAGRIYCNYLEEISYDTQKLDKELIPYTHPNQELIRIGILESLGTLLLPQLLPQFLFHHPEIKIQLFESSPQKSEENLLDEEIDCYIGQNPETLTLGAKCIVNGSEQYYIVVPSQSSFYKKDKFILSYSDCNVKQLLSQPLILISPEFPIRHQINGILQKSHIKPKILMQTDSILTATNLALHGMGITISPGNVIKKFINMPVNLFPIDKKIMQLNYFIAIKKNRHIINALQELITEFKNTNFNADINNITNK